MAGSSLWLRDFLPDVEPFDKARIMTVGYNSRINDSGNLAGMDSWARTLLKTVKDVRGGPLDGDKPIIFIGHSMGGLVARRAMELLYESRANPEEYRGISLSNCGLLFLSTPHLGTTQADLKNIFSESIAKLASLRKDAILHELDSFNKSAGDAMRTWRYMNLAKCRPPFECLCEDRETPIPVLGKRLVSLAVGEH